MKLIRSTTLITILLSLFLTPCWAQQAPDWTLKDTEGNEISLADYKGQPMILHFWATWCPYCKTLQPGLESLYQDFKSDGLALVGISILEEDGAEPQKELEARGHSFKTALNGEKVAEWYGVKGTPTTFFITKQGTVIWMTHNSDPNDPKFEQAVEYILTN
jgi:cytochrome c biogenesis protein CcmG/thiol:disulfide interchange protein DsbE